MASATGSTKRKGLLPRLRGAARKLVKGSNGKKPAAAPRGSEPAHPAPRSHPDTFRVTPAPPKIGADWPQPPVVTDPDDRVRYFPTFITARAEPHRFDVELFEQLNAEYESKPIWPTPPVYTTEAIAVRTRKSLMEVHNAIDLANKRVLEIGCGTGYHVWFLGHHFGSEATGIDVAERNTWKALSDDKTRFVWADITSENPLPEKYFDRIMSFAVWEHVIHPYRALQEVYRMLMPGGLAWMNVNLYRGPVASHLYREVKFPWPHLLFSDEVIKEFYRRKGLRERGATWVNKLTWAQYERYFEQIGFRVKMVKFMGRPFDQEFYDRFETVLNRYPRFDLDKDFFNVVLERPLDS